MKILLSGVETNNKGAELMLYAILQEIERKFPNAKVYIPYKNISRKLEYVKTKVNLMYTPFSKFFYIRFLLRLFKRLHISLKFFWRFDIVRDADWFIDSSGFAFSDQFNMTDERVSMWQYKLQTLYNHNCKIIFLPQAYGPVEFPNTRKVLKLISDKANLIMPREHVSYDYLEKSGVVDMNKVKIFTDFTSLVDGSFPKKYEYLNDGICIIPNMRMITKGTISFENYINLIRDIILKVQSTGKKVYLLNHEGLKDERLCYQISESLNSKIEVVTRLNAIETKGLISSAYLVISSRFHGVASALNSCVPCLATSWSHKYQELYNDYKMDDCVLPLDNNTKAIERISAYLQADTNQKIRDSLKERVPHIKEETRNMWNMIWNQK